MENSRIRITQITARSVFVPYEAPLGPYIGRRRVGRGPGTLGASALIVRIDSDAGITGWGEGTGELASDVAKRLTGVDACSIESVLALMREVGVAPGPASGVEMALWDLQGKAAGLPVCRLLGGRLRELIAPCPAGSSASSAAWIESAQRVQVMPVIVIVVCIDTPR